MTVCGSEPTSGGESILVDGRAVYLDLAENDPAALRALSAPRSALFGGADGHLSSVFAEVLFETRSVDPLVFGLVSALMLGIALLAAWVPARRAVRVDPMVSLRSE